MDFNCFEDFFPCCKATPVWAIVKLTDEAGAHRCNDRVAGKPRVRSASIRLGSGA
jgi:hypothetical protein